jgi:putative peptide zinc metalloprotease protein
MNRRAHLILSCLLAGVVALSPTAAGASDENVAVATNETDGAAVVDASVQYRVAPNGTVDEENRAFAAARCIDCQTLAAAFQLVLVTRDFHTLVPQNEAFALNLECDACLTWASAKQVFVVTGGPAHLTGSGHQRLQALEEGIEALEPDLPGMSLAAVQTAVNAAFEEFMVIASEEVVRTDGGPHDTEIVATRSS